jgi:hypothetical protein
MMARRGVLGTLAVMVAICGGDTLYVNAAGTGDIDGLIIDMGNPADYDTVDLRGMTSAITAGGLGRDIVVNRTREGAPRQRRAVNDNAWRGTAFRSVQGEAA